MKMIPCDIKEFMKGGYKKTSNLEILEEFASSECECVKIEDYPHKDAYVCASSLKGSIRRFGMTGIDCVSRNGKVFLIRHSTVE